MAGQQVDYEYVWIDCGKCGATGLLPPKFVEASGETLPERTCFACGGQKKILADVIPVTASPSPGGTDL